MTGLRRAKEFLYGDDGPAAAGIVAVAGLLLAFFLWRTFVVPDPREYDLTFEGADRIESDASSPTTYFRKSVYLVPGIRQAWINLSASDSFSLYINGNQLASNTFISAAVSDQYDLTGLLLPGKNVIAVRVARLSYPGPARLILRLGYRDSSDRWHEVVSDGGWKASPVPLDIPGSLQWYENGLDDSSWPNARRTDRAGLPKLPVPVPPAVMRAEPAGKWIGARDSGNGDIYFRKTVSVPSTGRDTWIQLAATGEFDLMINGRLAVSRNAATSGFDLYPINDWIHAGSNSLMFRVHADTGVPALNADILSLNSDGSASKISTGSDWEVGYRNRPGDEPNRWQPTLVLGSYGDPPWGYLTKALQRSAMLPAQDPFRLFMGGMAAMGAIAGVFFLWAASSVLRARFLNEPIQRALVHDAMFHMVFVIAAACVLLLSFDIRQHSTWPFDVRLFFRLCLVFVLSKLLPWFSTSVPPAGTAPPDPGTGGGRPRAAWIAGLVVIGLVGLWVRSNDLSFISLHHDEVSMVKMAGGISQSGYPHAVIGHYDKALTTYETVPYPIALSTAVFGKKDWSVRLPSVIFGAATLMILGFTGRRFFGPSAGLLAAALYAFLPWSVQWSQNAFYPQQTQLWALLTFWMFYEALDRRPVKHPYVVLTTIFFLLTYLSWEGTGFILPAIGLIFLVSRWKDWTWIRDKTVWGCLAFIMIVIAAQFSYRILSGIPYLAVGTGLSRMGLPSPFFLDPMYDPLFYVENFLTLENQAPLTIAVLLGVPFTLRRPAVRYLASLLLILLLCYTNFLSASATRYAYFLQPLLILLASGMTILFAKKIMAIAGCGRSLSVWTGRVVALTVVGVLFFSTNNLLLLPYRLSSSPAVPYQFSRKGVYPIDYRGASLYVRSRWRPGDIVIPGIPHTFEYYAGIQSDYYINTMLAQRIVYDPGFSTPIFVDRFAGKPVIRNAEELRDALYSARRAWIVAAPIPLFTGLNESFVMDLVRQRGRIVYESYDSQVYLWTGVDSGGSAPEIR